MLILIFSFLRIFRRKENRKSHNFGLFRKNPNMIKSSLRKLSAITFSFLLSILITEYGVYFPRPRCCFLKVDSLVRGLGSNSIPAHAEGGGRRTVTVGSAWKPWRNPQVPVCLGLTSLCQVLGSTGGRSRAAQY